MQTYLLESSTDAPLGKCFDIQCKDLSPRPSKPKLKEPYKHVLIQKTGSPIMQFYSFAIRNKDSLFFFSRIITENSPWHYDIYRKHTHSANYTSHENRGPVLDDQGNPIELTKDNYIQLLASFIKHVTQDDVLITEDHTQR